MALPRFGDLHLKRLEEIENNVRSFMTLQFEHNNFFRNELKDAQIARLETSLAQISDKQATLVNKMAAKPNFFTRIKMKI